jgi:hypothetical protein
MHITFWWGNFEGRDCLGDVGAGGCIILGWVLEKFVCVWR